MNIFHSKYLSLGTFLGGFILGILVVLFVWKNTELVPSDALQFLETRESGYQFINPLLECEQALSITTVELQNLRSAIESVLKEYPSVKVGLYYRDLTNGPWFGIDEEQVFSPQSLLKLPVALAYFKIAEEDPTLLDQKISYSSEVEKKNLDDNLKVGEEYSIYFLIERMLTLSDNVAFQLLALNVPEKYIRQVHYDLNIPYPNDSDPADFISVKRYAAIFRVLYNSSYLSRKYSETMLNFLSNSTYTNGISAHLPKEIIVAHKFGILNSPDSNTPSQLHDCGIIYAPERPYVLCVMSKGEDKQSLERVIRAISAEVYAKVSAGDHGN